MSAGSSERSASSSSIDPVSKVLDDLRRDGVADAVDLGDRVLALPREVLDRRGVFANVLRGAAVGGRLVLDARRFEQVGGEPRGGRRPRRYGSLGDGSVGRY